MVGVVVLGVVFFGLVLYGYFDYYRKVCEGVLNDRIWIMLKIKIKEKFIKWYIGVIKSIMVEVLKIMKCEINIFKEEVKLREIEYNINIFRISVCMVLDEIVF